MRDCGDAGNGARKRRSGVSTLTWPQRDGAVLYKGLFGDGLDLAECLLGFTLDSVPAARPRTLPTASRSELALGRRVVLLGYSQGGGHPCGQRDADAVGGACGG